MQVQSKRRRRWLRFSLRTMLIGTALVGVVLGLHLRSVRRQRFVKARIHELGGSYFCEWGLPISEDIVPNWLERVLGEDHFQTVNHVNLSSTGVSDDQLKFLDDLPYLETLYLEDGTTVTDDGLRHLIEIASLRNLYLPDTITDEGLAVLVNMPQLETLILSDSEVKDAGNDSA